MVPFLIVMACLLHIPEVQGGAIFSLRLLNYSAPSNRRMDGYCCRGTGRGKCALDCEAYMTVCISEEKDGKCLPHKYTTSSYGGNMLIFDDIILTDSAYYENPLKTKLKSWQGCIHIKVEVYDDKTGDKDFGKNPLMDRFSIQYKKAKPGSKEMSLQSLELQKYVKKFSSFYVKAGVQCESKYLIPSCNEFCDEKKDSTFTCDYANGKKVCKKGWYGKDCLSKIPPCTPKDDATGHYNCKPGTGERICLPGWKNPAKNCTEPIKPVTSTSSKMIKKESSSSTVKINSPSSLQESYFSSISSKLDLSSEISTLEILTAFLDVSTLISSRYTSMVQSQSITKSSSNYVTPASLMPSTTKLHSTVGATKQKSSATYGSSHLIAGKSSEHLHHTYKNSYVATQKLAHSSYLSVQISYATSEMASKRTNSGSRKSCATLQKFSQDVRLSIQSVYKVSQKSSYSFDSKSKQSGAAWHLGNTSVSEVMKSTREPTSKEDKGVVSIRIQKQQTIIAASLIGPFLILMLVPAILLLRRAYNRRRNQIGPCEANVWSTSFGTQENEKKETRGI